MNGDEYLSVFACLKRFKSEQNWLPTVRALTGNNERQRCRSRCSYSKTRRLSIQAVAEFTIMNKECVRLHKMPSLMSTCFLSKYGITLLAHPPYVLDFAPSDFFLQVEFVPRPRRFKKSSKETATELWQKLFRNVKLWSYVNYSGKYIKGDKISIVNILNEHFQSKRPNIFWAHLYERSRSVNKVMILNISK